MLILLFVLSLAMANAGVQRKGLESNDSQRQDFFWGALVFDVADGRAAARSPPRHRCASQRGWFLPKLLLHALQRMRLNPYAAANCAVIMSLSWTRVFLCPSYDSRNCESGARALPWPREQETQTNKWFNQNVQDTQTLFNAHFIMCPESSTNNDQCAQAQGPWPQIQTLNLAAVIKRPVACKILHEGQKLRISKVEEKAHLWIFCRCPCRRTHTKHDLQGAGRPGRPFHACPPYIPGSTYLPSNHHTPSLQCLPTSLSQASLSRLLRQGLWIRQAGQAQRDTVPF